MNISTLVEEEVRTEIFYKQIDNLSGGIIVEVGTYIGGNLLRIASKIRESNKPIKLYGIDDFHFVNISDKALNDDNLACGAYDTRQQAFYDTLINNIKKYELEEFVEVIDSDSMKASELFKDNSIDLLFLDGNHSYTYCSNELKIWIPKVKTGGIVSGHDWPSQGIQRAVRENFKEKDINVTSTNGGYWIVK